MTKFFFALVVIGFLGLATLEFMSGEIKAGTIALLLGIANGLIIS